MTRDTRAEAESLSEPVELRAICVVCGMRGRVRSSGGTVLTGGHDAEAGHEFAPATDFAVLAVKEDSNDPS